MTDPLPAVAAVVSKDPRTCMLRKGDLVRVSERYVVASLQSCNKRREFLSRVCIIAHHHCFIISFLVIISVASRGIATTVVSVVFFAPFPSCQLHRISIIPFDMMSIGSWAVVVSPMSRTTRFGVYHSRCQGTDRRYRRHASEKCKNDNRRKGGRQAFC